MSIRLDLVFVKLLVAAVVITVPTGCAENVSHRVGVVKSDLAKLVEMLGQPLIGGVDVMAKASSVRASVSYEGSAAIEVQKTIDNLMPSLGYEQSPSKTLGERRRIFCHKTEAARSVNIERTPGSPPTTSVSVSITGWRQDRETCPGKSAG